MSDQDPEPDQIELDRIEHDRITLDHARFTRLLQRIRVQSVASPPCECNTCSRSFREVHWREYEGGRPMFFPWYSKALGHTEARASTSVQLKTAKDDLNYVRTYWSTPLRKDIMSRWKNKSSKQRAACLKKAEPTLYEKQWCTLEANTSATMVQTQTDASNFRTPFLVDYLNVDGLKSDPMKLLGMIHNRVTYTPEQWALYDYQRTHYAWVGKVDIQYCELGMIMHGPEYGSLVDWNEQAAHRSEMIGFPRAQLVLEAQQFLSRFLRNVVEQLVGDLDATSSKDDTDELPQPQPQSLGRVESWSVYTHQPFSPPPKFDILMIIDKATAQLEMSAERLWLLQTSPEYLRESIRLMQNGLSDGIPKLAALNFVAKTITLDIWNYWSWKAIFEGCENLRDMHKTEDTRGNQICPGNPLPTEYEEAFHELQLNLIFRIEAHRKILLKTLSLRPQFRGNFKQSYNSESKTLETIGKLKLGGVLERAPVLYALQTLASGLVQDGVPQWDHVERATRFAFLDECLVKNPKQASLLDPDLYDDYTSHGVAQELRFNLDLHMPAPTHVQEEIRVFIRDMIPQSALDRHTILTPSIWKILSEKHFAFSNDRITNAIQDFVKAYDSHSIIATPISDQMRLERFDAITAATKGIWSEFRKERQALLQNDNEKLMNFSKDDIKWDQGVISAHFTPEYKAQEVAEREALVAKTTKHIPRTPAPEVEPWEIDAASLIEKEAKKVEKPKTRGTQRREDAENTTATGTGTTPPLQIRIPVKAKSLSILSKLYCKEETMGAVPWDTFVGAMADAGFCSEQAAGSAVMFKPMDNPYNWTGSINIHRPHPQAKIEKHWYRAIGHRMADKFKGWGEGAFVLRAKEE